MFTCTAGPYTVFTCTAGPYTTYSVYMYCRSIYRVYMYCRSIYSVYMYCRSIYSRTMAEAVSRWPLTAKAGIQSHVSPREIYGGQSGTRTGFSFEQFSLLLSELLQQCFIFVFIYVDGRSLETSKSLAFLEMGYRWVANYVQLFSCWRIS